MRATITFLILVSAAAGPVGAQTPHPGDIVKAEPVALGRALDGKPDITRFLLVRSARGAVLSSDGSKVAWISDVTGSP